MERLEYRLLAPDQDYPLLYYYDAIGRPEVAMRLACDYFVKDGTVFEKTSSALEAGIFIVYVRPAGGKPLAGERSGAAGLLVELRRFAEGEDSSPVIHAFQFQDSLEALLHLQCDYLNFLGQEWLKTATELDEDRQVWVFYARETDGS